MTLRVDIQGIKQLRAGMRQNLQRVRAATARAVTMTARDIQTTTQQEMRRVFRQPLSPYILKAFGVSPAKASDSPLRAEVYLKRDPQYSTHPLSPQVLGGTRSKKRFELALQLKGAMPVGAFAVPLPAALDGNLKVRRGLVQQIVAQAENQLAKRGQYGPVKVGDKRKARRDREAMGRAGGQFIFVTQQRGKLRPGIYLAEGRDFGAGLGFGRSGRLVKLFTYTASVRYRPRLDFFGIGQRIAEQRLPGYITSSLAAKFF